MSTVFLQFTLGLSRCKVVAVMTYQAYVSQDLSGGTIMPVDGVDLPLYAMEVCPYFYKLMLLGLQRLAHKLGLRVRCKYSSVAVIVPRYISENDSNFFQY